MIQVDMNALSHKDIRRKYSCKFQQQHTHLYPFGADLEDFLEHRPDSSILIERNILKEVNVAPTLIKVSERLKWEKKTSNLSKKIHDRPEANSLKEKGILKEGKEDDRKLELAQTLEHSLKNRPLPSDLKQKHILPLNSAPALQAVQHKLERNSQKLMLNRQLSHRPSIEDVLSRKIVVYNSVSSRTDSNDHRDYTSD